MKVLYTGSFNPWHLGHQFVYDQACKYFGKENVWIGIGKNRAKTNFADPEFLKWSLAPVTKNVVVYDSLTTEVCKEQCFDLIVRGIRPGKSIEFEEDLAYWNRKLGSIETILIPTPPEVNQISSSVLKELINYNVPVEEYVNKEVYYRWANNSIPDRAIYFGKCCIGKSTKLSKQVIDCDKEIWNWVNKDLHKDAFMNAILNRDKEAYQAQIASISSNFDWEGFFYGGSNFEAPCLGSYYQFIPKRVLSRFKIVRVSTSEENRKLFIEKRGVSKDWIDALDFMYRDAPYWDEELIVDYKPTPLEAMKAVNAMERNGGKSNG